MAVITNEHLFVVVMWWIKLSVICSTPTYQSESVVIIKGQHATKIMMHDVIDTPLL